MSLVMGDRVSPQMIASKPLPPTQTGIPVGFGGLMASGGTSGAQQSSSLPVKLALDICLVARREGLLPSASLQHSCQGLQ